MANVFLLEDEVTNDPLGRGYVGMTNAEVAADLNTEYRSIEPDSISTEVFLRGMDKGEWNGLTDVDRQYLQILLAREMIDIRTGTETRDALLALFPGGSQTRTNLLALATITVSRGVELGFGFVGEGDVWDVRNG